MDYYFYNAAENAFGDFVEVRGHRSVLPSDTILHMTLFLRTMALGYTGGPEYAKLLDEWHFRGKEKFLKKTKIQCTEDLCIYKEAGRLTIVATSIQIREAAIKEQIDR